MPAPDAPAMHWRVPARVRCALVAGRSVGRTADGCALRQTVKSDGTRTATLRREAEIGEWVVEQPRLPDDLLALHRAPDARVTAVGTVIAHHKILILAKRDIAPAARTGRLLAGREVRLIQRDAVHGHTAVLHLDAVAGDTDHALDVVIL